MADKVRVGVLGLTHDHVWKELRDLATCDAGVLVAAADPNPALREHIRSFGCEQVFDDYSDMLDAVELDAVYVFSDNLLSPAQAGFALDSRELQPDGKGEYRIKCSIFMSLLHPDA